MLTLVDSQTHSLSPHIVTHYSLISSDARSDFAALAAKYFVERWMEAEVSEMLNVWQNWSSASMMEKDTYRGYLNEALFSQGSFVDDTDKHQFKPLSSFTETLLRWIREESCDDLLILEPPVPRPPSQGDIDLVEITGKRGDYASMRVTLWEAKGSDHQVGASHNQKVYWQLDQYPQRLYSLANELCHRYRSDSDPQLKQFLRRLARMAINREPQVHYGAFITYDEKVPQDSSILPNLHFHPSKPYHPANSSECCHHLALFLLPDFKNLRFEVWRLLPCARFKAFAFRRTALAR